MMVGKLVLLFLFRIVYISFEPLEFRKIFCRDDGTKGVCKLDDLSPYGYNFSICRKELITPLYCKIFTQNKDMYTILNKNSSTSFPTAQRKWNTVFDINSNEWKQINIQIFTQNPNLFEN
jgi:hypothetical protein